MKIKLEVAGAGEFPSRITSELACRAFARRGADLSEKRFRWTYEEGYDRAVAVSAYSGGDKIGQAGVIFKTLAFNGKVEKTAELVDLFVSPESRDYRTVSRIYQELRATLEAEDVRWIYTYPNAGARLLNRRFLKLTEFNLLPVRIGVSAGLLPGGGRCGVRVFQDSTEISKAFGTYEESAGRSGPRWTSRQIGRRLATPVHAYAMACDGNFALLGSPRTIRGIPLLLVCASFCRDERLFDRQKAGRVLARLCAAGGRRIFLHAGWNRQVDFRPGWRVPDALLGNGVVVQSNFLSSKAGDIARFELLDLDYG
ncbi:hypothetical protein [Roseibium sp. Sym1]|uniref:hypothetical protein n=1 Tax=Roseibium sp. Sym1 TaxID=3016006 RepID=UPI0022B2D98B|nr:hypothetical protein [Roseibium sp. Sym1]